jgi:hypothetical protein
VPRVVETAQIEIEIETVYDMYRVKHVAVFGPSQACCSGTYMSGLDHEPPKFNLSKGCWGFLLPPGECDVREGGSVQSGACMGGECGGAACSRVRFDAVYIEGDGATNLDRVQMELCEEACRVESCFSDDELFRRVGAVG